jgi:hypothetical protein
MHNPTGAVKFVKKIYVKAGSQIVKHVVRKHEDMSSNPRLPEKENLCCTNLLFLLITNIKSDFFY